MTSTTVLARPMDLSKFRKSITKSIKGISMGFRDPSVWIDTGNYALNYLISGDFHKGVPLGKVTILAGRSGCLPETAMVTISTPQLPPRKITVRELRKLFIDKQEFSIATPDGFQRITQWYDKGKLPCVHVALDNGMTTTCANNHMLQRSDEAWILAENVEPGDELLTESGPARVTSRMMQNAMQCYDFTIDHANHRYYGDGISSHNSGKSYLASGNLVKNAQQQGITCVIIDTENAIDEEWLQKLGVDTHEDKLLKVNIASINECGAFISAFVDGYAAEYRDTPEAARPGVLLVVDSLGMLLDPVMQEQFGAGNLAAGSRGLKAKALRALIVNTVNSIADWNIALVCTNHTNSSQDPYAPDDIIAGGDGQIFAASIVVTLRKGKLKEDEEGSKTTDVNGIRSICTVFKSRFNHKALFKKVEIKIPFETGMQPSSGLFEFFEENKMLIKEGNRYSYAGPSGSFKEFRKNISQQQFDWLMQDYPAFVESQQLTQQQLDAVELLEQDAPVQD